MGTSEAAKWVGGFTAKTTWWSSNEGDDTTTMMTLTDGH